MEIMKSTEIFPGVRVPYNLWTQSTYYDTVSVHNRCA